MVTGITSTESTPDSDAVSAQELRGQGNALAYHERSLRISQGSIAKLEAQIAERQRLGKNYSAQQTRLDGLRASYEERLEAYRSLRASIGEGNIGAAQRAAPKQYHTGGSMAGTGFNPGQGSTGIKYSQPGSLTGGGQVTPSGTRTGGQLGAPVSSTSRGLAPGVYVGGKGEQVIVQQGRGATTAGELVGRLRDAPFTPASLPTRSGQIVGVVQGDTINLGRTNLQVVDSITGKPTGKTINTIPLTAINGPSRIVSNDNRSTNTSSFDSLENFEKQIQGQKQRQRAFENSLGMQRIRDTASLLTFGFGVPRDQRGFFGRYSESLIYSGLNLGIGTGGALASAGEKIYLLGKGFNIKEVRPQILPTLKENFGITANQFSTQLSDPAEAASFGTQVLILGALGGASAKTNPINRAVLPKAYPKKFTTAQATGIKFVEDVTVPTSLRQLRSFEGQQNVPTIHVTTATLPKEFVTQSQAGAGGFRQQFQLYQFYKASPEVTPTGLQPRAYLAYAGITSAESTALSSGRILFGNPTVRILQFNERVTPTPRSLSGRSVQEINLFQGKQSGKTFVPAENIKGLSTEGQFITPARYVETQSKYFGLVKETKTIPGYESFAGSKISLSEGKFFYYKQQLPELFGIIPRSKYFKMELVPAATSKVVTPSITSTKPPAVIELARYNKSYQNVRSFSPSPSRLGIVAGASTSQKNSSPAVQSSSIPASSGKSFVTSVRSIGSSKKSPPVSSRSSGGSSRSSTTSSFASVISAVSSPSNPSSGNSLVSSARSIGSTPRQPTRQASPFSILQTKRTSKKKRKYKVSAQREFLFTPTFAGANLGIEGEAFTDIFKTNLAVRPVVRGN